MNKTEYKALSGKIDTAIRNDEKTDTSIHELAVQTLQLAAQHGDFTLFARLVGDCKTAGGEEFGRGVRSRRIALLEWVGQYSPIRINGDGVMGLLKPSAKTYTAFNVDAARANPFWTLEAEAKRRTTNKPFDLATFSGRLSGLVKGIDKALEAGTVTEEDATVMREIAVTLNTTFARELRKRNIDLAKIKAARDAVQPETPVNVESEDQPSASEPANAEPNVGGKVVNE